MDDPRSVFLDSIELSKLEIQEFSGFIFFCGGPISDVSEPNPVSARDQIYRYIWAHRGELAERIRRAEDIQDWFRPSVGYKDLITFENHIAELADAVVIFVESPGAIAEVGAFSQIPSITKKLLVFVQERHADDESFINLGPLDFLRDKDDKSVGIYPWVQKFDQEDFTYDPSRLNGCESEIADNIERHIGQLNTFESFKSDSTRHSMLLLCDLMEMFSALTITELNSYVDRLGLGLTKIQLKGSLYILQKFDYASIYHRGHNDYYATVRRPCNIAYNMKKGVDRVRRKDAILDYYESEEPVRFKAIKSIRSEMAGAAK